MSTLSKWGYRLRCKLLRRKMRDQPYEAFYREVMSIRASDDPKEAVGGLWEEMGQLQLDFLTERGLQPGHRLLDLGCGCLRGGLKFIEYLEAGRYVGIDISPDILAAGEEFLAREGLDGKGAKLILGSALRFDWFDGERFDFIFAQSVLTHMPIRDVERCFSQISRVLKEDGVFYATFFESESPCKDKEDTTFYFPFSMVEEAGERQGLLVERVVEFEHPRNQQMLRITRRDGGSS